MKRGYFTEQQKHGLLAQLSFGPIKWSDRSSLDKDVYIVLNEEPLTCWLRKLREISAAELNLALRSEGRGVAIRCIACSTLSPSTTTGYGASTQSETTSIQSHHIFPVSLLYDSGYVSGTLIKVNEIANRALNKGC